MFTKNNDLLVLLLLFIIHYIYIYIFIILSHLLVKFVQGITVNTINNKIFSNSNNLNNTFFKY